MLRAQQEGLGGGWEIRAGQDFVSTATKQEMGNRINWGGLLSSEDREQEIDRARSDFQPDDSSWSWRWWPEW